MTEILNFWEKGENKKKKKKTSYRSFQHWKLKILET